MGTSIGDRIRLRRSQLGLTQQDVADRIMTSQRQLYKYEHGMNSPTAHVVALLAQALETTSDWLLGLTEDVIPIPMATDLGEKEKLLLRTYRSKSPEQQYKLLEMARII